MRPAFVFVLVMYTGVLMGDSAIAQGTLEAHADSLQIKHLLLADSSYAPQNRDTVRLAQPSYEHGLLASVRDLCWRSLNRRDFQLRFYRDIDEVLGAVPAFFPLHLGYMGQANSWSVFGASARDLQVRFNGHALNDPGTGLYFLNQYSAEFAEQIDLYVGSPAVVLGDNASAALLNIQEPLYNSRQPYTRIWFADGPYGYIASDGVYSQNVAPNLNITAGFHRQAADGRYANQGLDSWNLRALVRWNPSSSTSISLVENFTNHGYGSNGGVDTRRTEFVGNEVTAFVIYPGVNQRVFRHELSLNLSTAFDTSGTWFHRSSLYYHHSQWEMGRSPDLLFTRDSSLVVRTMNVVLGVSSQLEFDLLQHLHTLLGAEAELQRGDESDYTAGYSRLRTALYAYERLRLGPVLLGGGIRTQLVGSLPTVSLGVNMTAAFSNSTALTIDVSRSSRLPTPSENLQLNREHAELLFAELKYRDSSLTPSLTGFLRRSSGTITASAGVQDSVGTILRSSYTNGADPITFGLNACVTAQWNRFVADVLVQSSLSRINGVEDKLLPLLYAASTLRVEFHIGQNLLTAGVAARAHSGFSGISFVPLDSSYPLAQSTQPAAFGGLDLLAGARLGSAFVKVYYQNIFSNLFSTVSTFPTLDRNLSISVAWTFFD